MPGFPGEAGKNTGLQVLVLALPSVSGVSVDESHLLPGKLPCP